MHLAAPLEATLGEVDAFLRRIWLECCGHSSAFRLGETYGRTAMSESRQLDMPAPLCDVLHPGLQFYYEYDFGSPTGLQLKVVGLWDRDTDGDVQLLARNHPPEIACDVCGGRPATQICSQCQWKGKGWLCAQCAQMHPCSREMFLPVVNSPRVGVCAYCG